MNTKEYSGADIIVRSLEDLGVDTVFGYPGNNVLPVFDSLSKSSVSFYLTAHEQGAAHCADGYARASGKTGVVIATSGPGATNLVTGIANAFMDSSPVLAICGNVPLSELGKDSFQEIDITGIVTPITKHCHIVKSVEELEYSVKYAYYLTEKGRKSPVLIDVPYNILLEKTEYKGIIIPKEPKPAISEDELDTAAKSINEAKNPIILAGGGCLEAKEEINALAEKLSCPIVSTLMGIALPNSLGLIGKDGYKELNDLLYSADLVIACGTRLTKRSINPKKIKSIVHIDIDEAELDKNIPSLHVRGDVGEALPLLLARINHKEKRALPEKPIFKGKLSRLFSGISELLDKDTIIITDVGQHQIFTALALDLSKGYSFITSGGLGAMGFGVGGGIGAAIASRKKILLITGDGSFNMNQMEIPTAVRYGIPLTVVIINNRCLGMIRELQKKKYAKNYFAVSPPEINYTLLAKSYGANGLTMLNSTIKKRLVEGLQSDGVTIINYYTRQKDNIGD